MQTEDKKIKYPENLYLQVEVFKDKRTQQEIAKDINFCRKTLSLTINGHYKGTKLIPALLESLAKEKSKQS